MYQQNSSQNQVNSIAEIQKHLRNILLNKDRENSEIFIIQNRSNINHLNLLIQSLQTSQDRQLYIATVLEIKQIFKRNYQTFLELKTDFLSQYLEQIREQILILYMNSQDKMIDELFSDIIKILTKQEYFSQWTNFQQQTKQFLLFQKLPMQITQKILSIFLNICYWFEHSQRNEEMYKEIMEMSGFLQNYLYDLFGYILKCLFSQQASLQHICCLNTLLWIFRKLCYQTMSEQIEDNLSNWIQQIKIVLNKEFDQHCNLIYQQLNQQHDQIELGDQIFKIKGEIVKIILLFSSKYQSEFHEYINEFAEQIWTNCISLIQQASIQNDKEVLLVSSIRYFKHFSKQEMYQEFFKKNFQNIIINLIIPSVSQIDEDLRIMEEEPVSFVQTLFQQFQYQDSQWNQIADFLNVLSKVYQEEFVQTIQQLVDQTIHLSEHVNPLQHIIQNAPILLEIFCQSFVWSSSLVIGATEIGCNQEIVQYIYDNAVSYFWKLFAQHLATKDYNEQFIRAYHLLCVCLKFVHFYKLFLNIHKLYSDFCDLFKAAFHLPVIAIQTALIQILSSLLTYPQFTIQNNLNADLSNLSFVRKTMLNPRNMKAIVAKDKQFHPLQISQEMFQNLIFQMLEAILNTLQTSKDSLTVSLINCLSQIQLKIIKYEVIDQTMLSVCCGLLSYIQLKAIPLNLDYLSGIFGLTASFINKTNNDISQIEQLLFQLYNTNDISIKALVIQILVLILNWYNQRKKDQNYIQIINESRNLDSYKQDKLALSKVYLFLYSIHLQQENINVAQEFKNISDIFQHLLYNNFTSAVFEFLTNLIVEWVQTDMSIMLLFFCYDQRSWVISTIQQNQQQAEENYDQLLLIKYFLEAISVSINILKFQDFIGLLSWNNLVQNFIQILGNNLVQQFLMNQSAYPQRSIISYTLLQTLTENFDYFSSSGFVNQAVVTMNSIMKNIQIRKVDFTRLQKSYQMKEHERKNMNDASNNESESVYILSCMPNKTQDWITMFTNYIKEQIQLTNFDSKLVWMLKEFANQRGIPLQQLIPEQELFTFVNEYQQKL